MNTTTKTLLIAVVCIALGIFGGYEFKTWQVNKARAAGGNVLFGQGQRVPGASGQGGTGARRFGGGGPGGGRPVIGSVVNIDDKSMTIKEADGSTRIVLFSDNTSYTQSQTVTKATLKVGDQVGAFGTDNTDGSLTAQNVQLNPMFMGLRGGGQPSPSASPVATPATK
ncbi:MAG TPA: hypothetical protein VFG51_02675 [Candidatus Saccharimonadia bacterium]|nr:hypothetical protein [Candidatus Saccharimonadia bacterium]